MSPLTYVAALAAAGATGTLLRAGCNTLAARCLGTTFPWGTLAVNVAGSFAIGAVVALARSRPLPPGVESIVLVGLLGGFTTYSSFALQSMEMLQAGRGGGAIVYLAATNVLALAAAWAGLRLAG